MEQTARQSLLDTALKQSAALIEPYLEAAFPSAGLAQQTVSDAMRYSLLAGGKRIRPFLLLTGFELAGGD
ncbi:MAG: polyprenyl synthetase family protein, partial [Clostridia bacterium]|nr:polyprenyl synthetase family protein [Clostridia bacterium]